MSPSDLPPGTKVHHVVLNVVGWVSHKPWQFGQVPVDLADGPAYCYPENLEVAP